MEISPQDLHIRMYPDESLRRKAEPLESVTEEVRAVAERMIELMREAEGIGLAAPQVGLPWRLFVAEIPEGEERSGQADPRTATVGPEVYVNPVLSAPTGDLEPMDEGCLSLPEITGEVRRPPIITIEAMTLEGERVSMRAGGLLSRCWQHEADHLDGVLIIDRMTPMSRLKNRSAVRDLERSAPATSR